MHKSDPNRTHRVLKYIHGKTHDYVTEDLFGLIGSETSSSIAKQSKPVVHVVVEERAGHVGTAFRLNSGQHRMSLE